MATRSLSPKAYEKANGRATGLTNDNFGPRTLTGYIPRSTLSATAAMDLRCAYHEAFACCAQLGDAWAEEGDALARFAAAVPDPIARAQTRTHLRDKAIAAVERLLGALKDLEPVTEAMIVL